MSGSQHPTPREPADTCQGPETDWKSFQGHYSQVAGEASEPHDACWELEWLAQHTRTKESHMMAEGLFHRWHVEAF